LFVAITVHDSPWPGMLFTLVACALGVGVLKDHRWALRGTAAICLLFAVALPLSVFNPFVAMDLYRVGKPAPTVPETLIWLLPLEAVLLLTAFLLDPKNPNVNTDTKGP
jgi:hypothetical protein